MSFTAFYIVRTPLHYLNATEARFHSSNKATKHILIVLSDYHRSLKQFDSILEKTHWDEVYFPWRSFEKKKNNPLFNAFSVLKRKRLFDAIIKSIQDEDAIFWGNLSTTWFYYLLKKNKAKIHLLDDGFATINTLKELEQGFINSSFQQSRVGKIEHYLLKPKLQFDPDRIGLFTNYNLNSKVLNIVKHQYEYLAKSVKIEINHKQLYFIGQPFIFQKMMDKERYIQTIQTYFNAKTAEGITCFYVPHRSTTMDYIPKEWNTLFFDFPLESITTIGKEIPVKFVTFYSSAAYNLAMILKNENCNLEFLELTESQIQNVNFNNIASIYNYLRENPLNNITISKL